MKKINLVVLRETPFDGELLGNFFKKNFPDLHIESISSDMGELVSVLSANPKDPRILLLDISRFSEADFHALGGFNLRDSELIFLCSHSRFALKAIQLGAVDYIMKPFRNLDLSLAVQKAMEYLYKKMARHSLSIKTVSGFEILHINRLLLVESDSNYSIFHMENGDRIISAKTLKAFAHFLESNNFMRVHRSYYVNTAKIKEYHIAKKCLILTGGMEVEVARSKHEDVIDLFKQNFSI